MALTAMREGNFIVFPAADYISLLLLAKLPMVIRHFVIAYDITLAPARMQKGNYRLKFVYVPIIYD